MTSIKWRMKNVGTIANFLTPQECDAWIAESESAGYEEATVNTGRGMTMMKEVRNNDRLILDDPARADGLYARLGPALTPQFSDADAIGLNERLRLYRYDVGQKFDWHQDGWFARPNGDASRLTFMIYLNDDFAGGGTSFQDKHTGSPTYGTLRVQPEKGMALVFHHPVPHRGDEVTEGRKYVLRSDVMYRESERASD